MKCIVKYSKEAGAREMGMHGQSQEWRMSCRKEAVVALKKGMSTQSNNSEKW